MIQYFKNYIPYKVITVLLTIFPVLYVTVLWFIYFYNCKFVTLNPLHLFCNISPPPPTMSPRLWQPLDCSLSLFLFCYICSCVLVFWSHIYVKTMVFVSLWFWMFFCIIHFLTQLKVSFIPGISNQILLPTNLHPLIFFKLKYIHCSFFLLAGGWFGWLTGWLACF